MGAGHDRRDGVGPREVVERRRVDRQEGAQVDTVGAELINEVVYEGEGVDGVDFDGADGADVGVGDVAAARVDERRVHVQRRDRLVVVVLVGDVILQVGDELRIGVARGRGDQARVEPQVIVQRTADDDFARIFPREAVRAHLRQQTALVVLTDEFDCVLVVLRGVPHAETGVAYAIVGEVAASSRSMWTAISHTEEHCVR